MDGRGVADRLRGLCRLDCALPDFLSQALPGHLGPVRHLRRHLGTFVMDRAEGLAVDVLGVRDRMLGQLEVPAVGAGDGDVADPVVVRGGRPEARGLHVTLEHAGEERDGTNPEVLDDRVVLLHSNLHEEHVPDDVEAHVVLDQTVGLAVDGHGALEALVSNR